MCSINTASSLTSQHTDLTISLVYNSREERYTVTATTRSFELQPLHITYKLDNKRIYNSYRTESLRSSLNASSLMEFPLTWMQI